MKDKTLLSSFILPLPPPLHYQRCQLSQITWESPGYRTNPRSLPSGHRIFQIEAVLIFPLHSAKLLTPNLPTFDFLNIGVMFPGCFLAVICYRSLQKIKETGWLCGKVGVVNFLEWWGGSIWVNFFMGMAGGGGGGKTPSEKVFICH